MNKRTFVSLIIIYRYLEKMSTQSEKMELVQFAKNLGYGDITQSDAYDVSMMYVGEDGERQSMGYTYVCSELLYNPDYEGAIDAHFAN